MGQDNCASCLCKVCTCGRHKLCKPVKLAEAALDTHTEYGDHYQKMPLDIRRGKAAPQELSVGGEFYGSTENRQEYVLHQLPPRFKIVKPQYVVNEAKLESVTTQRANYQPHPNVQPPKRRQQPKWQSTSGSFSGISTSKTDYVEMPLPPHYVRQVPPYVKTDAKLEGITTQNEDYKPWGVTSVPSRRKQVLAQGSAPEDRDFKSTTNASYVEHSIHRELVRAPQHRTTDSNAKLEGQSTSKEAYTAWQLPPRYQRHLAEYAANPNPLDGTSTYTDTFVPKTVGRYVHPTPAYVPNQAKFEGQSTNKSDFMPTGKIVRREDFAPRNAYYQVKDDRDFVSTTHGSHSQKPLPHCVAADWMPLSREVQKDGHMRLKVDH